MEVKSKSSVWATGFAMFSMFFGAGNVVFPLVIGKTAGDMTPWALMGLMISAIGVPFLGLISMTLFNGNYKLFFERVGKVPGFLIALVIMMLIGPFGAMPRLITLSYETFVMGAGELITLPVFAALSCVTIFLCTFRKNRILDVLGYYLTPFLLLSLLAILVIGLMNSGSAHEVDLTRWDAFFEGLNTGYA
ncbi:MAG: branched-chain amino acid transport system II carrier protein, partial [Chlamydiia bacterium]|nr:branched-chain amino acid transport system II carrier protein [Chlamydiia bacterium]